MPLSEPSPFFVFLGRLHPLLVHFPIALILAATMFELVEWAGGEGRGGGRGFTRRKASPLAMRCLGLGAFIGVLAVIAGWINANVEPQSQSMEETLFQHRWFGVGATCAAVVALLFAGMERLHARSGFLGLYRFTLLCAAALVGYNAHLGGELVHGKNHLFSMFTESSDAPVQAPTREAAPSQAALANPTQEPSGARAGAIDYAQHVAPIFAARCVECHGPKKQKGDLRLDTLAFALEPPGVIVPGDALGSFLYRRITLPLDHEDHMPAKGDPLTEEQVRIVRAWIDGMAPRTN